jgi:hypothetical protein
MSDASVSIPAVRRSARSDQGRRFGWLLIAPCLAMLAANSIFPLIYVVTIAFQNYQILIPVPHRFIGLRNFEKAFSDPLFWSSLGVTCWFIAGVVLLQFPFGFGLAILLNRLRPPSGGAGDATSDSHDHFDLGCGVPMGAAVQLSVWPHQLPARAHASAAADLGPRTRGSRCHV